MSVFEKYAVEEAPLGAGVPDSTHFYGLAKRLGEEVLEARVRSDDFSAVALRLCVPMSDTDWLASDDPFIAQVGTAGTDVLSAFRAALRHRGDGFRTAPISGDRHSRYSDLSIARELLGWSPSVVHPLNP
jgi:nucleoside-diphosphate-sugar epimerase